MVHRGVFILFVALSGCASPVISTRPPAPIPADWGIANAVPQQSSKGGDIERGVHWREFFKDPQLQALLEIALENNRDVRIAALRVEEARAQFGLARAERFPLINLTGAGSYTGLPADLSGTGGYAAGQRFDLNLTAVSFELDFWGRLANLNESARQQFLATESARRAVNLSIVAEIASAYFSRLQSEVQLKNAQELVRLREESMAVVQKGVEIGATYGLEFEQTVNQLESSRSSLAGAVHQHNIAVNRLSLLTGYAATGRSLPPARALADQGLDLSLPGPFASDVLLQRPDVMAAEQRLAASQANIAATRAAFFPRIVLTAGMGVASQALSGLLSGGTWNFQPSATMPLFDFGRNAATLDVSRARKDIAVADYGKTIQTAFREVADLLSARQALAIQMRAARVSLASEESRQRAISARYQAGLSSYLEVLDVQRDTISVRQTVEQLRRSQLEVATQLYKALGAA